jgi:chorismate-pyruvate lyase
MEEARFIECQPEQIPQVFRNLLVHAGDMTSKLAAFHQCQIALEVLQCGHGAEGHYNREVILRNADTGEAVEYGAIEIFLETVPDFLRAEIIKGKIPLGGLLNTYGVRYHSEPQAFFCVRDEPLLCELLRVPGQSEFYGRCNILRTENKSVLARILEVLPPV